MDSIHVAEHRNAKLVARRIATDTQDIAKGRRRLLALAHGAGSFEHERNRFEHAVDTCDVARGAFDLHDAADVGKDGVAVDRVLKKGGHVGPSVGGAVGF
jgi:isopentenyl phosphate kinase